MWVTDVGGEPVALVVRASREGLVIELRDLCNADADPWDIVAVRQAIGDGGDGGPLTVHRYSLDGCPHVDSECGEKGYQVAVIHDGPYTDDEWAEMEKDLAAREGVA